MISFEVSFCNRTDLGELGRLLIIPRGNQSQFSFEVAGEPDDPMTQKRREILEPIYKEILDTMVEIGGKGEGEPTPYASHKEQIKVEYKAVPCE